MPLGISLAVSPALSGGGGGASAPAAGVVKGVYHGSVTLSGSGVNSGTWTIKDKAGNAVTVDTAKCIIVRTGHTSGSVTGAVQKQAMKIRLTNSTTVTVDRQDNGTAVAVVQYFDIVEFTTGILSAQFGQISVADLATSGTVQLNAVSANAIAFHLGNTSAAATNLDVTDIEAGVKITTYDDGSSHSVVTGYVVGANATSPHVARTINVLLVDFDTSVVDNVQQCEYDDAGADGSQTFNFNLVTPVDLKRSIVVYQGATLATSHGSQSNWWLMALTDTDADGLADRVVLTRIGTDTTGSKRILFSVLTFKAGVLDGDVQRGTNALSSQTSKSATLTSAVDPDRSLCNWNHCKCASGTADLIWNATKLSSDGTTVDTTIGAAASPTAGFEVAQFKLAA